MAVFLGLYVSVLYHCMAGYTLIFPKTLFRF